MEYNNLADVIDIDKKKAYIFLDKLGKWQKENSNKNMQQYLKDKEEYKKKLYKELKIGGK